MDPLSNDPHVSCRWFRVQFQGVAQHRGAAVVLSTLLASGFLWVHPAKVT